MCDSRRPLNGAGSDMTVHPSHRIADQHDGWSDTHCSPCSLSIEDERIEQRCSEEPHFDPYSAPDAWAAGFAENH